MSDSRKIGQPFHCFACEGEYFLVDVESQEFFEVHPAVHQLFACAFEARDEIGGHICETFGSEVAAAAFEVADRLRAQPAAPLPFTEDDIVACYAQAPITTVNLLVSYRCNLACSYCYSSELRRRSTGASLMRPDTAFRAVDLFMAEALRLGFPKVTFKFSGGGEPLTNFDIIRQVIRYARSHRLSDLVEVNFKLSTNGILLDAAAIEFFKDESVELKISIDGCEDVHQRRRLSKSGEDTYRRLLSNIGLAVEKLSPARVTAAVTIFKAAEIRETIAYLLDLGLRRIRTQKAILPESPEEGVLEKRSPAVGGMFRQYYELLQACRQEGSDPASWPSLESIDLFLEGLNRQENKRYMPCNAGIYDCAVDPEGAIYSCNRFAGDLAQKMGDVFIGIDPGWRERFCRSTHLGHRSKCLDCWLVYWCGGNCNYQNQIETGDLLEPSEDSCNAMKTFFEHAIRFYCMLRRDDPEMLEGLVSRKVF
jgi:uncharacterized protein